MDGAERRRGATTFTLCEFARDRLPIRMDEPAPADDRDEEKHDGNMPETAASACVPHLADKAPLKVPTAQDVRQHLPGWGRPGKIFHSGWPEASRLLRRGRSAAFGLGTRTGVAVGSVMAESVDCKQEGRARWRSE